MLQGNLLSEEVTTEGGGGYVSLDLVDLILPGQGWKQNFVRIKANLMRGIPGLSKIYNSI